MTQSKARTRERVVETRSFVEPVEFRGSASGRDLVAEGVAVPYMRPSRIMGRRLKIREQFQPGAFRKSLEERNIRAVPNHDEAVLLGMTKPVDGRPATLRFVDSDTELRYELDVPDTTAGRDMAVHLERGEVVGSSVGFAKMPGGDKWGRGPDGLRLRSVTDALFVHISPLWTREPAYNETSGMKLAVRSLAEEWDMDVDELLELDLRAFDEHADSPAGGEAGDKISGEDPSGDGTAGETPPFFVPHRGVLPSVGRVTTDMDPGPDAA